MGGWNNSMQPPCSRSSSQLGMQKGAHGTQKAAVQAIGHDTRDGRTTRSVPLELAGSVHDCTCYRSVRIEPVLVCGYPSAQGCLTNPAQTSSWRLGSLPNQPDTFVSLDADLSIRLLLAIPIPAPRHSCWSRKLERKRGEFGRHEVAISPARRKPRRDIAVGLLALDSVLRSRDVAAAKSGIGTSPDQELTRSRSASRRELRCPRLPCKRLRRAPFP